MQKLIPFLLILIGMAACRPKEVRYMGRLDGVWNIAHSERVAIFQDGSIDRFEDLENAGTLRIYEPSPPAEYLKEFVMEYTNFQGNQSSFSSLMYTDEARKRVMFSKVLCNSPFDCDIVWTVDVDRPGKQIWSAYGNSEQFFVPPDRYNAANDSLHLRWTITLERD